MKRCRFMYCGGRVLNNTCMDCGRWQVWCLRNSKPLRSGRELIGPSGVGALKDLAPK